MYFIFPLLFLSIHSLILAAVSIFLFLLYQNFQPLCDIHKIQEHVEICSPNIFIWLSSGHLKLFISKTKFIIFPSEYEFTIIFLFQTIPKFIYDLLTSCPIPETQSYPITNIMIWNPTNCWFPQFYLTCLYSKLSLTYVITKTALRRSFVIPDLHNYYRLQIGFPNSKHSLLLELLLQYTNQTFDPYLLKSL